MPDYTRDQPPTRIPGVTRNYQVVTRGPKTRSSTSPELTLNEAEKLYTEKVAKSPRDGRVVSLEEISFRVLKSQTLDGSGSKPGTTEGSRK